MMRNNKLYKILRITFLVLAIVSMTFTIFYKVGHCEEPSLGASSGGSGNDSYYTFATPLPVVPEVGCSKPLTSEIISSLVNRIQSGPYPTGYPYNEKGFDNLNVILFNEYNSSNNTLQVIAYYDCYINSFNFPSDYSTSSNFVNFKSLNNYALRIEYNISNDTITYVNSTNGNHTLTFYPLSYSSCYIYSAFSDPILNIDIYGIKTIFNISNYPIYLRDGSLSFSGDVKFSSSVAPSGNESDKQDSIDDIDDSIEDSSQLPQVDDELPADPTTPNLIKKILSALKTINKTIGGVGISIVDTLKKILGKLDILDDIKQFYQDYNNIKNTSSADVVSAFQGTIIYTTYSNIRSDISSFLNMFNVTPASSAPTWTIPLNGTVLYNQNYPNIVIDFGFYDRFRNTVSNILVAILTCSCVFNIIRSIPDIITGASGDESS